MATYFNTDTKCYTSILDDNSLNNFLSANFDVSNISSRATTQSGYKVGDVQLCSKFAIDNSKRYFLISDFVPDVVGSGNFSYNCYIPKSACNDSGNSRSLSQIFKPFTDTLNTLLGHQGQLFSSTSQKIIPENKVVTISGSNIDEAKDNTNKCFQYVLNNGSAFADGTSKHYFAKRGNFYLYKTPSIYPENGEINTIPDLQHDYKYYKGILDNNFSSKGYYPILLDLERTMKNYFCTGTTLTNANENYFDNAIIQLNNFYAARFNDLNEIVNDINKMTNISNHETDYLEYLDNQIGDKNSYLSSLKDFDGANDGKLSDRQFLRTMKLCEINIIFIVIILMIFAYSKRNSI